MSNVLFGKLGQDIIYDRGLPTAIRSNTNGNYEAYNILRILSATLSTVFVVEDNIQISFEQQLSDDSISIITDFVPKIDCAFIQFGTNEFSMSKKLLSIINSGIKWYMLCSDPRCLTALTSFVTNPPAAIFAGANGIRCNIAGKPLTTRYLNIESANIYGESQLLNISHKHDKLIIVANQTNTWDRIGDVKRMISLVPREDVIVYGRVDEKDADDRFGGEHPISFIYNAQRLGKVTYIAPIEPGWITAKYLECISRGVIPLMSPTYATTIREFKRRIDSVDSRLFVNNPEELLAMYQLITSDKEYYRKTIYSLQAMVYYKYGPKALRDNLISLI